MRIKTLLATACLLVSSMTMVAQTSSFLGYCVTIDGQDYFAKDITIGEKTVKIINADDTSTSFDISHGSKQTLPMKKALYCVAGTLTPELVKEAKDAVWCGAINDNDLDNYNEYNHPFFDGNTGTNSTDGYESFSFAELDVSSLTTIMGMLYASHSLKTIDFAGKSLDNVTNLNDFVHDCTSLESVDFSNVLKKATYMLDTFNGCSSLKTVDFSGCDLSNVTQYYSDAFSGCTSLTTIKAIGCNDGTITAINNMLSNAGLTDQVTVVTTAEE